ncbi:S-adenosyl-L-methionine-dependent methyltransferase [Gloeopeniophorella convolvens]|nr:S-adenosyl-L-methionine-dependent methyltransferase [Gloeopeniophorella convolvens]
MIATPPANPPPVYALPHNSSVENQRLDDQHAGVVNYLGRLILAPITNPKRILELGSGTGRWAAEAAAQYPDTEIVAVDLTSPVTRLPPNVSFKKVDIMGPLPFEKESFDVIHARFLLFHLPNVAEQLPRIISLLKPDGWLLIEELGLYDHGSECEAPTVQGAIKKIIQTMKVKGQDPHLAITLRDYLVDTGSFSEINDRTISVPMNPHACHADSAIKALNDVLLSSLRRALAHWQGLGLPPEAAVNFDEEVRGGGSWKCNQYLTASWSRKFE